MYRRRGLRRRLGYGGVVTPGTPWVASAEIQSLGATAIHTPPAGLRFQLMGAVWTFPPGLLSGGNTIVDMDDAAGLIAEVAHIIPPALTAGFSVFYDFSAMGGYISTADNAVLNGVLAGNAFTAANNASVTAWGYDV